MKLMSSWSGLRSISADFRVFPLLCMEWIFCEIFLALFVSSSRVQPYIITFSSYIQWTCVHCWTCLFLDLMFLALNLSIMIRLLFEWTPSLLCCIWQFPIKPKFLIHGYHSYKIWHRIIFPSSKQDENPEIKKTFTGKGCYPFCSFYFFSFSIIKTFAELSFPVTLCIPVSFSTENTFSFIQLWSYCWYKWIFSINIILCSQVWITSKKSAWKEQL